jgi:hypothetical protein
MGAGPFEHTVNRGTGFNIPVMKHCEMKVLPGCQGQIFDKREGGVEIEGGPLEMCPL